MFVNFQHRCLHLINHYFFPIPSSGLEYFIEIQHNTVKRTAPAYSCLLCDANIKEKSSGSGTLELARAHLRSSVHKIKYLVRGSYKVSVFMGLKSCLINVGAFNWASKTLVGCQRIPTTAKY
jgi:hypothetical protein